MIVEKKVESKDHDWRVKEAGFGTRKRRVNLNLICRNMRSLPPAIINLYISLIYVSYIILICRDY